MERNSRIWNHGKEEGKNFYALRLEFEFLISLKPSLQKLIAWNCSVAKLKKFSRSRPSKRLFISLIIMHVTAQRLPSVKHFPLPRKLINHETYPLIYSHFSRSSATETDWNKLNIMESLQVSRWIKWNGFRYFYPAHFLLGDIGAKFSFPYHHISKPFECFYEWADKSVAWGWNACQSDCMSEVWFYAWSFERCVRNVLKIM